MLTARRALALSLLAALSLSAAPAEKPAPRTGVFVDDCKDEKGVFLIHYKACVPESLPKERHLGLVVYFHGINGNEESLYGHCTSVLKRLGLLDGYVVMGGKSKGNGWSETDDRSVLAWIEWACQTYPVDRRRVHLVGYSNGGFMVTRFGWAHQDLFASVLAYAGTSDQLGTGKLANPSDTKTEWYLVHGEADSVVGVACSRQGRDRLRDRGCRHVYREVAGKDHGILGVKEVDDDAFRWIYAQRHKEIPPSAAERKALGEALTAVKTKPADVLADVLGELARIGGPPAAPAVAAAFGASAPEVRADAAKTARETLYGREAVVRLGRLLQDKSDDVKREAAGALGVAANWRYAEAQQALALQARSKSAPAADRVHATNALGQAVRLCFVGKNFEDKGMFWTLVGALEDAEPAVREAAIKALHPAAADDLGFKADAPPEERKTAVAKWKDWCSKTCGPP